MCGEMGVAGTVVDATWVGERVLGPGVLSCCEGPRSETHPPLPPRPSESLLLRFNTGMPSGPGRVHREATRTSLGYPAPPRLRLH